MLNVAPETLVVRSEMPDVLKTRPVEEHTFASHDGTELFYRKWPALTGKAKGAILLFHRGHEHGGRMAHIPDELGLDGFAFYAWDARGHGKSPGPRGYSPSFAASVRDLDRFVKHVRETDGFAIEDIAVVAQSVGAVLAATWVHDYAPKIRSLVLASPAFDVRLYVPFARAGIGLWQKLKGTFFVNSYVKARFLTHDAGRIASFEADPLITRPIASNILLELYEQAARVVKDARAITVPTQLLISGSDFVVRQEPQHAFFVNLGSTIKERHVLPGFYHDTLGEKDRAQAFGLIRGFLEARFARPAALVDLRQADKGGHTRDESDRLATPLARLSPAGLCWAMNRLSIRIAARFSDGIATGVATGFDSGSTLDYVYRNQAKGFGPLGRLIDRVFLEAIGWRGIRRRKQNIEAFITEALTRFAAEKRPAVILDIAAGHGRYVLDAVAATEKPASIRLQDYYTANVEAGRKAIRERGLEGRATFLLGDAFDGDAIAAIDPKPSLAIVSGLYELFSDNMLVARSLDGLARVMPRGGLLIYTNQPWHPQLEMIARSLTSHRGGNAWVMRRRTQGEMDQLVEAAGFRKIDQRIDEWGIFTVSLAQRDLIVAIVVEHARRLVRWPSIDLKPLLRSLTASALAMQARLVTGVRPIWQGCQPSQKQRIYFANHGSHVDFILLSSCLPPHQRAKTRGVAAADYWGRTRFRRLISEMLLGAVLVERNWVERKADPLAVLIEALDRGNSLIMFPEGTRNMGEEPLLRFRSGLYGLATARPDVELIPCWLENMSRVLPKGEFLPVPLLCRAIFGAPVVPSPGEEKFAFLARARATLLSLDPKNRGEKS